MEWINSSNKLGLSCKWSIFFRLRVSTSLSCVIQHIEPACPWQFKKPQVQKLYFLPQKILFPWNSFWVRKNYRSEKNRFKKILGQNKILGLKKILGLEKNLGLKKISGQNFCIAKTKFWSEKSFVSTKFFVSVRMLGKKTFLVQKILVPNQCLAQKDVGPKSFRSNPLRTGLLRTGKVRTR